MATQNYKNHVRILPLYHGVTFLVILSCLIFSIVNLFETDEIKYPDAMFVAISFVLLSLFLFARMFALKAQDRAIRAEESLRYYILTGKRIPQNLSIPQLVALRFAADEEFVAITDRAAKEDLQPKQIKMAIKNWRGDYHRV